MHEFSDVVNIFYVHLMSAVTLVHFVCSICCKLCEITEILYWLSLYEHSTGQSTGKLKDLHGWMFSKK